MQDFHLFIFWSIVLLIVVALTGYPKIFRWWTGHSWHRHRQYVQATRYAARKPPRRDLPRKREAIPPNPERVAEIAAQREERIAKDSSPFERAMRRRLGEDSAFSDINNVMMVPEPTQMQQQITNRPATAMMPLYKPEQNQTIQPLPTGISNPGLGG